MFTSLIDVVKAEKQGFGKARKRAKEAVADEVRSSRTIRTYRGIKFVIPERSDQIVNRNRKGSAGRQPVSYDRQACSITISRNTASTR